MVENCMQEPDYEGVYDSTAWIITAASYLMPVAMAHSQSLNFQSVDVGSIKNLVTMYVENAALLASLFLKNIKSSYHHIGYEINQSI